MEPLADLKRAHAAVQATEEMYRSASRRRAEAIARAVASGVSLRTIATTLGITHVTVHALAQKGRDYLLENAS
jgi:DNA-binding NarL/FixJ family response regulator